MLINGKCYLLLINQRALIASSNYRPTGTCYFKTGKVIAEYLKPLTKNELVITNTQQFPSMLNNVPLP